MDPDAEILGDQPVRLPRASREVERLEPGEPWRPPRRLVVTAVLVLLTALAATPLWQADRRARAHESAALDQCRRALGSATVSADLQLMAAAANLRPTLATTSGKKHEAALRILSNPARLVLPEVVRADGLCRAVSIRPWHRTLKSRQASATTYSRALTAKVRAVVSDGGAYFGDPAGLRRLRDLRRAADLNVLGGRF